MQIARRRGMKKAIWLWHAGAAIGVYAAIRREKHDEAGRRAHNGPIAPYKVARVAHGNDRV